MQQPLPAPDEHDGEAEEFFVPPPQLTPEQRAEISALEVFPGGAATLESDEWWQQAEDAARAGRPPEPLELSKRREAPGPEAADPAAPHYYVDEPAEPLYPPTSPEPLTRPLWATEQSELAATSPSNNQPPVEPATFAPEPVAEPARPPLSRPSVAGREQRAAAGASQRAAILAAAGTPLTAEELATDPEHAPQSAAEQQLAVAMGGAQRGAPAGPARERRLTRKIVLSLVIILLTLAALSGGAISSGQGAEVERVASSLAPDVIERWLSERWSSFGSAAPVAPAGTDVPGVVPDIGDQQLLFAQIGNTSGAGVPVRSTCVPEASTPRTINEGAAVAVIAQGIGDCSGWNVVRAGAVVSWVESLYLEPIPLP